MLKFKEHKGLYVPTVLPSHSKAQNGALRRPGETWQGTTGVWFYKRPDGKVIRIEPPNKPGSNTPEPTAPKAPTQPVKDTRPLEVAEERGIITDTLRKLALFEMGKLNQLRAKNGQNTYNFPDLRLKVVHPDDVELSKEITQDMLPRIKLLAQRLEYYDGEFATDYAPVLLASDGRTVVDGNNRAAAHKMAGLDEMLVLVPRRADE